MGRVKVYDRKGIPFEKSAFHKEVAEYLKRRANSQIQPEPHKIQTEKPKNLKEVKVWSKKGKC